MDSRKHVVIVGGGFAGLNAARKMGNAKGIRITLVDRRNHHLFQPLLYQVALAALSPADIAAPIRSILSNYNNIEVLLGNVRQIDVTAKNIITGFGELSFDQLILACGANHSYFGNPHWEEYAPGLKSLEEATEIRRRVLMAYEMAERETDPQLQKELLTFVVVGGGPTGVELAGAIGEISRITLARDFQRIDPRKTRVILIEGGPRLLPAFDPALSVKATRDLEKIGVTVWTDSQVTDVHAEGVLVGKESIRASTVLWAAGVAPSELNQVLPVQKDRAGRVIVDADLCLPGYPDIFVIGDQSHFAHTKNEQPLPGLCPVAIQQGRHVARNIIREVKGKPRLNFKYNDKGIMATIGRNDAVVESGPFKFTGLLAWLTWLFVHIFYLIGFRNRVGVFLQWAWSYMTLGRGARLITSRNWKSEKRFDLARRYSRTSPGHKSSRKKTRVSRKPVVKKKSSGNADRRKSSKKSSTRIRKKSL